MHRSTRKIGELLIEIGALTNERLEQALEEQARSGRRLGHILVDRKLVTERDVVHALSLQSGIPFVSLRAMAAADPAHRLIPREAAERHRAVAVCTRPGPAGDVLVVAMADPRDREAVDALERMAGRAIQPVFATEEDVRASIERWLGGEAGAAAPADRDAPPEAAPADGDAPLEAAHADGEPWADRHGWPAAVEDPEEDGTTPTEVGPAELALWLRARSAAAGRANEGGVPPPSTIAEAVAVEASTAPASILAPADADADADADALRAALAAATECLPSSANLDAYAALVAAAIEAGHFRLDELVARIRALSQVA